MREAADATSPWLLRWTWVLLALYAGVQVLLLVGYLHLFPAAAQPRRSGFGFSRPLGVASPSGRWSGASGLVQLGAYAGVFTLIARQLLPTDGLPARRFLARAATFVVGLAALPVALLWSYKPIAAAWDQRCESRRLLWCWVATTVLAQAPRVVTFLEVGPDGVFRLGRITTVLHAGGTIVFLAATALVVQRMSTTPQLARRG